MMRAADRALSLLGDDPDEIVVIGRQWATRGFKDVPGYRILDVPTTEWSEELNDAWVQAAIQQRRVVYLASYEHPEGLEGTIFHGEWRQFMEAGYEEVGGYLYPPGFGS